MTRFAFLAPALPWLAALLWLPAAAGATEPSARPGGAASAASAASAAAAGAPNDTIEYLNQRLGDRLGSVRQPARDGSLVLRVPTRPLAAPAPTHARAASHAAAAASASHAGPVHWSYEGLEGPPAWSRLDPAFAQCGSGQRQSPIDIRDGFPVQLDPIGFHYQPSAFRVIDNGHTVQANLAPGNAIEVLGRRYQLVQFHFHRPSEARIDGRAFDMEVHLVHRDDEGRLAVVAVLLESGSAQPVVQQVWNNLPLEKGEEQAALAPLDPGRLLPEDRRYFTYMGSLTTPPCTEGVLWLVLQQPVQMAPEQIALFGRLYPMNARPVQPGSGRIIKASK